MMWSHHQVFIHVFVLCGTSITRPTGPWESEPSRPFFGGRADSQDLMDRETEVIRERLTCR